MQYQKDTVSGDRATQCWDSAGNVISCEGTGQDGDVQAGGPISYTDNGDGTITDNNTGLMWEKKSKDGTFNDFRLTYTWDQAFTVHIAGLNAGMFAGHSDWRLPNVRELSTLVDYAKAAPAVSSEFNSPACMDALGFVTVLTGNCTLFGGSFYWSSTTMAGLGETSAAWAVYFGETGMVSLAGKVTTPPFGGGVRAVRCGLD